jgi:Chlorophyll A-B binding protein
MTNTRNVWATEPQMTYVDSYEPHNVRAELLNGRLAMIGFVAAVISYALTGNLVFGVI